MIDIKISKHNYIDKKVNQEKLSLSDRTAVHKKDDDQRN